MTAHNFAARSRNGTRRLSLWLLAAWIALASADTAASDSPPATTTSESRALPRVVVLIAACSVNRGYLEPYDASVSYTPYLAELGRKSVVFQRHISEAGQSGPAYASILTGTQADRHGVYHHPTSLANATTTLTEVFAKAGWEPYFWSLHTMAAASLNYAQGVPPKNLSEGKGGRRGPWKGDPVFDRMLKRLRRSPSARAIAVATPTAVHSPYNSGRPSRLDQFLELYPKERGDLSDEELETFGKLYSEHRHALQWDLPNAAKRLELGAQQLERLAAVLELHYKRKIHALDAWVGQVMHSLRQAGLLEESLIVFTSDHGEILYRDNAEFAWTHGLQLAPEVLNVPLIVYGPSLGLEPGVFEGVTRSIDLLPTLAGLSGVEFVEDFRPDGIDLSGALLGRAEVPRLQAFFHSTNLSRQVFKALFHQWDHATALFPGTDVETLWVGMRDRDLVAKKRRFAKSGWGYQLFDLAADPEERRNIYDPDDAQHAAMALRLERYKQLLVERYPLEVRARGSIEREALERLRSLGYVE